MSDWIGDAYVSDAGWRHVERLVDAGDRMAGSPGEREAAEATRDALAERARDARLDEFDVVRWIRGTSAVRAADGREYDCVALPRSPSAEVAGPLVDLGHGLPGDVASADLDGAVAMVDADAPAWYTGHVHRREKYAHAVDAGAAGFLYRSHVPGCLAPTGTVGTTGASEGEIPAVGVSREVGARLARCHAGDRVEVAVDADIRDATSRNVHAEVGPDVGREVLVTAHVDAHDVGEGAVDNAAGAGMVVQVASALADRADDLDARVRFVTFGAEEVGLVGSRHEADRVDADGVRAVLNLDGVVRSRTLSLYTHGFESLGHAARSVADRLDVPISVDPRMNPHSDHWPFVARGIPGCHLRSEAESSTRGWGHTAADTFDKLDRRDFREQAIAVADLAATVAGEGFETERTDPADVAATLESQGLAGGMRATGDWPF